MRRERAKRSEGGGGRARREVLRSEGDRDFSLLRESEPVEEREAAARPREGAQTLIPHVGDLLSFIERCDLKRPS